MKFTYLGQAGLYIESDFATVIIDPYLSNSVEKVNPKNYRRQPIDDSFLSVEPDFLLFTHNHLDHYDPETAPIYLAHKKAATVLSPTSVWNEARQHGGEHNYVEFNPGTEWTDKGLRFRAVKAVHSDPYAIGFVIEELTSGETVYVTGDTLYNSEILASLPDRLDAIFLPINGVGNNMNMIDAARFAKESGARCVVPLHFGLFDELDPTLFACENRVIPEIYKEIKL